MIRIAENTRSYKHVGHLRYPQGFWQRLFDVLPKKSHFSDIEEDLEEDKKILIYGLSLARKSAKGVFSVTRLINIPKRLI